MKSSFITQNYLLFINSFKRINLKFFLILAYDIVFYFVFMQIGNFFLKIIEKKSANVDLTQNLLGLNQQAAAGLLGSVRGFFFFLVFSAILFLVLMAINWSVFKGLIWTTAASKKFNFAFFKRFLLLNLIWLPSWFLLIFLFAVIIEPAAAPIFMAIALIMAFYFTNILYPLFLKESRISKIKDAFKLGIRKFHHFIVPYAIIIILFLIFSNIYGFVIGNVNLNQNIGIALLLVFVAWTRYYFIEVVYSLHK